ncbi:MAG TPA: DUF72 domain-containing protein [Actinomycetota bacterium]|jgi:uncharacterized protein YecE (DUF72 family)|nr:DUF72 domain-containing protein [Actinomycetota bacterium]
MALTGIAGVGTYGSVRVLVGTSGWRYDHWRGRFYPQGLPTSRWLSAYAERFATVEVNNTFYHLPKAETFARWAVQTPAGFVWSVKASRYVTHIRRLRDCGSAVELLWSRAIELGPHLGPILFQLPPTLAADPARLAAFLRVLPTGMRAAFEFRHPSWLRPEVLSLLDGAGAALVLADRPGARVRPLVTGGWSYVRLHQGRPDAPGYARRKLARWAERIAGLPASEAFVYFNNDTGGAAVQDALTMRELLAARGIEWPRSPRSAPRDEG